MVAIILPQPNLMADMAFGIAVYLTLGSLVLVKKKDNVKDMLTLSGVKSVLNACLVGDGDFILESLGCL